MAKAKKSENVPKAMKEKFERIVALTDEFSREHLNDEYAQLIRFAVAALCRKRPSPLDRGRDRTWACGITHALGMINFLFDPSQEPHISAGELYDIFGVSASTGQAKSKQVRDTLKMSQMDPNWGLPSKMGDNPMIWMLEVNGFIMDVRSAPRDLQEMAFEKGLIPYIPGGPEDPNAPPEIIQKANAKKVQVSKLAGLPNALYSLEVFLFGGPVAEDFIEENPVISRTIELKGSHTLADLHRAIFEAFDREEDHLYEFQIGGSRPNDPKATRYSRVMKSELDDEVTWEDAEKTALSSLGLTEEDVFGYWFDFGDNWWHQVNVLQVRDKAPKGKYPKVSERIGASPPQYADFD